ncbi:MAG: hypothetical protein VX278_09925 [Myxococcota bacterium]|nr:hypothetical protein [Myxococcota bacterium]
MSEQKNELSALERHSLKWSARWSYDMPDESPRSRSAFIPVLKKMERNVILRGALAGALSGIAAALGMLLAEPYAPVEGQPAIWEDQVIFYAIFLSVAMIATVLEIAYLYYDGMKVAVRMGRMTGAVPTDADTDSEDVRLALIQAGLEIPARQKPLFGIDPLAEKNRWLLLLFALSYKLKISVTSFVVKAFVKRLFARFSGRVVGRAAIELVAVPIFAIWNAIVCRQVMLQARVRALGPLLVDETMLLLFPQGLESTPSDFKRGILLTIRHHILSCGCFHPNTVLLTKKILGVKSDHSDESADITGELHEHLNTLSSDQQKVLVEFFTLLCAYGGRPKRDERKALQTLCEHTNLQPDSKRLQAYIEAVMEGKDLAEVASGRLTLLP